MIDSLKMTQCRLDALNSAFLNGSPQYDWDGLQKYNQKLLMGSSVASTIARTVSSPNFTIFSDFSELAEIYMVRAESVYSGIKATYASAQITFNDQNNSQNIALSSLIPNFTTVFSGVDSLINLLSSAASQYRTLEVMLNESMPALN